jgi:myosin heavy subunit
MIKELEKVSEIFLNDVDSEEYQENLQTLKDWENGLEENRLFLSWQSHDVTQRIVQKAKESYKEFGLLLATNRNLTDVQRQSLWAKQDACAFLLSLTTKDALAEIQQILTQIEHAIKATS